MDFILDSAFHGFNIVKREWNIIQSSVESVVRETVILRNCSVLYRDPSLKSHMRRHTLEEL